MSDPDPQTAKSGRLRLWLRIVLGVSLALNLLVIGLAVGAALRLGGPELRRPPPPTGVALIRALPPEDRKAILRRVRDKAPNRPDRAAEAQALADALTASPFDPEALDAVATAQTGRRNAFQTALLSTWLDHVAAMSAQDRADYAQRILRFADHNRRDKDKGGRD